MGTSEQALRAALYSRVSLSEQNLDRQRDELRSFASSRKWNVVVEESDKMSGARAKRPGFQRVMELARSRKIDVVVVQSLDRFGRSLVGVLNALDELRELGVGFVSLTQQFDTTTPSGQLLFHITAAFAQFERSMISERVRSGMAAAKRRGVRMGRPKACFKLSQVEYLRERGESIARIANAVGISRSVIQRSLARL